MSNNNNNNLHPLYIEQQQWFAQFQQPQQQQQQLGYKDHRKNYRFFKHCNIDSVGCKDQEKRNAEIDIIQIVKNTKILYIDCNNIKYACDQWNKFRGKPKKQIKRIFKIIMQWLLQEGQKLEQIHLIWDVFQMHKMAKIKLKFKEVSEMKEEPNKFSFKSGNLLFTIQSAYPGIADDLIVELSSQNQDNGQTTVVTSDRGLRQRLEEKGVSQFIGNGKWWKLQFQQ